MYHTFGENTRILTYVNKCEQILRLAGILTREYVFSVLTFSKRITSRRITDVLTVIFTLNRGCFRK